MNELLFNFEGHEVEIINFNGQPLFNPYDVGKCLDLSGSTVRRHMQYMNQNQVIKLTNAMISISNSTGIRKLNNAGENFLTESGVCTMIINCHCCQEKKQKVLSALGFEDKIILTSRKELDFINNLEKALAAFNIEGIRQYQVLNYRIDYYIPRLKVAIEYDENGHKHYSYEQHELRQIEIEEKLGCKFIRVTDKNEDYYNIGLVLKQLFDKNWINIIM